MLPGELYFHNLTRETVSDVTYSRLPWSVLERLELHTLKWLCLVGWALWCFYLGLHLCHLGLIWFSSALLSLESWFQWGDKVILGGLNVEECSESFVIYVPAGYSPSDPPRDQWEWWSSRLLSGVWRVIVEGVKALRSDSWLILKSSLAVWFEGVWCIKPGKLSLTFTSRFICARNC
jgi:hypothetical protein